MALFLAIGMGPENDPSGPGVWISDYMPTAQDEVLEMLSDEFKDMIANPDLHQLTAPITGEYNPTPCEDSPHLAYFGKKKRSCDWIVQKRGAQNQSIGATAVQAAASATMMNVPIRNLNSKSSGTMKT